MMRLINCGQWRIETFHDKIPEYAILSHTWQYDGKGNPEDVTYHDLKAYIELNARKKQDPPDQDGWNKVKKARDMAWKELNIMYIWIDSCCINQQDTSELTTSINSMYRWYAQSAVCIAYLSDQDRTDIGPCRWFNRGWTLQELIAPSQVLFYNKDWKYCGSRNGFKLKEKQDATYDLSKRIAKISSIDEELLSKNDSRQITRFLSSVPACQKMSWASERETTKPEDMAYCLTGIFDINHMHLKSGEGRRAFIRLQEEIIKQSGDLTLFAWQATKPEKCNPENLLKSTDIEHNNSLFKFDQHLHGIFACHPREFELGGSVKPAQPIMYNDEVIVTSKGVKFTASLEGSQPCSPFTMPLHCYNDISSRSLLGMELRWVGGDVYARSNIGSLKYLDVKKIQPSQDHVYVTHKIHHLQNHIRDLHQNSIHIPKKIGYPGCEMERTEVSPGYLWSEKHELLMTSGTRFPVAVSTFQRHLY